MEIVIPIAKSHTEFVFTSLSLCEYNTVAGATSDYTKKRDRTIELINHMSIRLN